MVHEMGLHSERPGGNQIVHSIKMDIRKPGLFAGLVMLMILTLLLSGLIIWKGRTVT